MSEPSKQVVRSIKRYNLIINSLRVEELPFDELKKKMQNAAELQDDPKGQSIKTFQRDMATIEVLCKVLKISYSYSGEYRVVELR